MQRLWLLELGWSDELPFKEEKEWRRFIDSLEAVNNIAIDRCIVIHRAESIELHAFSDASEKAYGSSIYLKSISALGEVKIHRESRELKTFVANRVSKIHQLSSCDQWHHIASEQNPADVLSRGLLPEELRDDSLWWHGPELLQSTYSTTVIAEPTQRDDFDCELRVSKVNTLQQRGKWMIEKDNVMCGTMVIVKEDFTPVCSWLLGRVVEVYHGSDGKVRTVRIKTKTGKFRRPITEICILPIDGNS
ncbi:uncharacterized protein TNCV_2633991 [Trichonephila clavipes]|nr:uncharacterized protein TNCV_2633991 [Trichonephila clavipes]